MHSLGTGQSLHCVKLSVALLRSVNIEKMAHDFEDEMMRGILQFELF